MQAKNEMEAIKALNEKIAGIVESGSNSNGSWVKFADGTMICSGHISQTLTRTTQRSDCRGIQNIWSYYQFSNIVCRNSEIELTRHVKYRCFVRMQK